MVTITDKRHLHNYYIQIVGSDAMVYKKIHDWYLLVHHPVSEAFVGNLYYWSEIKDKVIPIKPTSSYYSSSYKKTLGEIEIFEVADCSKFDTIYKIKTDFSLLTTEEMFVVFDVNIYSKDDLFCIIGNRNGTRYISNNGADFELLDERWENELFNILKYIYSKNHLQNKFKIFSKELNLEIELE